MANHPTYPGAIRHRSSQPPVVVKIGGGLLRAGGLDGLRRACDDVAENAGCRPVLVVPGGGPFADAVRTVDRDGELGDRLAHRLALAAMDQLGTMLHELLPRAERVSRLRAPSGLGLLLAAPAFAGRAGVPESWTVTSDSLAVLAAGAIGAPEAILLKAVPGVLPRWPSSAAPFAELSAARLRELQAGGRAAAVDAYLPTAIERTGVSVRIRAPGPDAAPGTLITSG
jgi:5-(aminomethyl)-3-furanmethanol phosphate kinase